MPKRPRSTTVFKAPTIKAVDAAPAAAAAAQSTDFEVTLEDVLRWCTKNDYQLVGLAAWKSVLASPCKCDVASPCLARGHEGERRLACANCPNQARCVTCRALLARHGDYATDRGVECYACAES